MKKNQVRQLSRKLLPFLPGYVQKGFMLYESRVEHVLRGFYFEDSGFDAGAFYVWVFFLPLYVPTSHISFNFGHRLGGANGKKWTLDDPALGEKLLDIIVTEGLAFLSYVKSPSQVEHFLRRLGGSSPDSHQLEAIAYSIAISGDSKAAASSLDDLLRVLDPSIGWQQQMIERARTLRSALDSPGAAKNLLLSWEASTRKNLGLEGL
jgi:hypothetical protein